MRRQRVKRTNRHAFAKRLHALFMGKRNARRPPIDLSHETNFERRVYTLISKIPRGHVMTYGGAATAVESKRHARAVGGAMASNPLPLIVPCHRIVKSTLSVGNYGLGHYPSKTGTSIKREILRREGVRFKGDRISRESLWKPRTR
jgi:methylated-DNA-[protein]-cysteine S-methyltransferase